MSSQLSPYRLRKARNVYDVFTTFSAFSYTLLSGNIITLFALRLGASSTTIGVLNAFAFISFFFMPVGKRLVSVVPIVKVFGYAWLFRYLSMIPLLAAPFFAARGRGEAALALMLISVFLFHVFRGVGMISNNPIINELAAGPDRGGYVVKIQVINSGVAILASVFLAALLGRNPPLGLYGVFMVVGIVAGVLSSWFILKIPEPAGRPEGGSSRFFETVRKSFSQAPFRLFIVVFFLVSIVSSTARTFSVVYSRDAYLQGDGAVALFTVFGGLGALAIGLFSRLLVDRIGAKPLYVVYTAVSALSLIPAIVSPSLGGPLVTTLFLSAFLFAVNFGFAGAEGVAQNYFFGLVKPEDMLDLGILYYVVFGIAGAIGSFLGGVALDFLAASGFSVVAAFRVFFGLLLLVVLVALFFQRNLVRLGSLPLKGALGVIFSFRDLRGITLLNRLDTVRSPEEESRLLEAIHDAPTSIGSAGILDRVHSPRLAIRAEAIRAVEALPELTPEAEDSLISDVEQNPYTTAYASARVLGRGGSHRKSVPLLRKTLFSDDYMLAGESMVALARQGDEKSLPLIEDRLKKSYNPRLLTMGAAALEIFAEESSIPTLLDILRIEAPSPYLRDEVMLSVSGILGFLDRFYPAYVRFLSDLSLGNALVLDVIEAASERYPPERRKRSGRQTTLGTRERVTRLKEAIPVYLESNQGASLSRWVQDRIGHSSSLSEPLLAEAALDVDLSCYERFRFLLCFWTATLLEKELIG